MLQIVYVSTARQVPEQAMLEDILQSARRNNRKAGVTGLLVSGGRRFLQALEGPDHAVLAALHRIVGDPRHFALVELARKPIDRRTFGSWDMAYRQGAEADEALGPRATLKAMIGPIGDKTLEAQFGGFADLHDKAA